MLTPNSKTRWPWLVALVLLVGAGALCWWYRWFANEPAYHGKTVTEWLDAMPLFKEERVADETEQRGWTVRRTPEAVARDPAIRALRALGSNAVPVLARRMEEGPLPPRRYLRDHLKNWVDKLKPTAASTNTPTYFPDWQRARKLAAGFTVVALGTNAGGGFGRFLEICGNRAANSNDVALGELVDVPWLVKTGLPDALPDCFAAIDHALSSTNPVEQVAAAQASRGFREQASRWRDGLFHLARDGSDQAREIAIWALAQAHPNDPAMLQLNRQILSDTNNPSNIRAAAAVGIGQAGPAAVAFLPLLKGMTQETDTHVRYRVREAIRYIEKPVRR